MNIALAIPVGAVFGGLVQSSGVSSPLGIRAQFIFEKEIMMKMFLGGLGGSALSLMILHHFYEAEFNKAREGRGWGDKGAMSALIGGWIQGTGMAFAGSCPGMAFAQLGTGVATAPYVYAGGVAGAFLYSALHPWLKEHHAFDFARTLEHRFESMHLERVFFSGSFKAASATFAAATLGVATALEQYFPWRADVADVGAVNQEFALNPTIAGLSLGFLQLPAFMFLGTFLGASSGYSVISSQALRIVPEEFLTQYSYAKNFINSKARWQVGLGIGIMIGAALTSGLAENLLHSFQTGEAIADNGAHSVPALHAAIGGFLIVFGARFVGGCASGHGLSGLASLHVVSWFTVPAMFAGAIFTGNVLSMVLGRSNYLLQ